jgi:excisionase family DNA binding protein
MKTSDLSIKELAAFIGVSTDTIRRAVRKGEIPATRVGTSLRFDLRKVGSQMEWNAVVRLRRGSASAPGGTAGRAQADQPPSGNTGALLTRIITGVLLRL